MDLPSGLVLFQPLPAAYLPRLVECFVPVVEDGRLHLGGLDLGAAEALRDADPSLNVEERVKIVAARRASTKFHARLAECGASSEPGARRGGHGSSDTLSGFWAVHVAVSGQTDAPPEVWSAQRLEMELLGCSPDAPDARALRSSWTPRSQEELGLLGFRRHLEGAPPGSGLREFVRAELFLRSIPVPPLCVRPALVPGQKVSETSRKYDTLAKKVTLATAALAEAREALARALSAGGEDPPPEGDGGATPERRDARRADSVGAARAALAQALEKHTKALAYENHMICTNKSKARKKESNLHVSESALEAESGKTGGCRAMNSRRVPRGVGGGGGRECPLRQERACARAPRTRESGALKSGTREVGAHKVGARICA
jgi:hypothetical protein